MNWTSYTRTIRVTNKAEHNITAIFFFYNHILLKNRYKKNNGKGVNIESKY